jgi:hypothetical protein
MIKDYALMNLIALKKMEKEIVLNVKKKVKVFIV